MEYSDTTTYQKIEAMHARINICQGGSSSGKTIAILMILLDLSFDVSNKTITVMTDTLPALRRGAMKDWRDILRGTEREIYFVERVTEHTWVNRCTGTRIEFMACDDMGALGARREYLFVNEANRINYETFGQLEIRTLDKIWVDYNPSSRFWIMDEVMDKRDDWEFCKTTFLDNEALPQNIVDALLQRRGDGTSNFWRVYGLGEVGTLEGNIYKNWEESTPEEIKKRGELVRYGLDFGFGHPTGMTAIYENPDGSLGIIEEIYEQGIGASEYPSKLKAHHIDPTVLIVADAARPEIIADIRQAGYRIIPANKDAGSVRRGISRVEERKITFYGENLRKEYLSYAWRKKRSTGETIYEPEKSNDDLVDSLRYAIDDLKRKRIEF